MVMFEVILLLCHASSVKATHDCKYHVELNIKIVKISISPVYWAVAFFFLQFEMTELWPMGCFEL